MDGVFSAMTPFYTAVINRNVEIIFIYLNKGETDLITSGKIDSNSKLCLTFILTFMFIKFFLSNNGRQSALISKITYEFINMKEKYRLYLCIIFQISHTNLDIHHFHHMSMWILSNCYKEESRKFTIKIKHLCNCLITTQSSTFVKFSI